MSPLVGPRRPQQAPAPRRVSTRSSTRVSSLRSRGTSGSSSSTSFVTTSSHVVSVGSPQSNKSKLTQYRLGVGRPSVAVGSGTRQVSRSTSSSKVNRGRVSRSYKPPEATIVEGALSYFGDKSGHRLTNNLHLQSLRFLNLPQWETDMHVQALPVQMAGRIHRPLTTMTSLFVWVGWRACSETQISSVNSIRLEKCGLRLGISKPQYSSGRRRLQVFVENLTSAKRKFWNFEARSRKYLS